MAWTNRELSTAAGSSGLISAAQGAALTAATTTTLTDFLHTVSGSATITTLAGGKANTLYVLVPAAGSTWSLGTGGNINTAVTATAGVPIFLVYDGTTYRVLEGVSLPSGYGASDAQRADFGNGVSKPLSDYYSTLADAQVDYPHASALTDELDWAIAQGVIDDGDTLTIDAGKALYINRPIGVVTNSRIVGDTKGNYSAASRILVSGNIAGIEARDPEDVYHVRISDVTINNVNTTIPTLWAASTAYTVGQEVVPTAASDTGYIYECTTAGTSAASEPSWSSTVGGTVTDGSVTWTVRRITRIGIDAVYMSFAQIERVSARYHHAAIRFSDRISEQTLGAETKASKWVASTAYTTDSWVVPTTAPTNAVVYECTTAGTSGSSEPVWPTTAGTTVADGTAVWTARVVAAGYYSSVVDPEIASCAYGIRYDLSGNSIMTRGGRIASTRYGAIIGSANQNTFFGVSFEKNGYHSVCKSGASSNYWSGSRFEGNELTAGLETRAGLLWLSGSTYNAESGNHFSNMNDSVRDEDGRNTSLSPDTNSTFVNPSGIGSGRNLIYNPSFEIDSDANGLADGFTVSSLAGLTCTLDSTIVKDGTYSQKVAVAAAAAAESKFYRAVKVRSGVRHMLTFWSYSSAIQSNVAIRVGTSVGDATLANLSSIWGSSHIHKASGAWIFHRAIITPTTSTVYITFQINGTVSSGFDFYLDAMKLEEGVFRETGFSDDSLSMNQLTVGASLASAATIALTHSIHPVTGTTTTDTITPPTGFSGVAYFLPSGAWPWSAAGNIITAGTATGNLPVIGIYNPNTSKWWLGELTT